MFTEYSLSLAAALWCRAFGLPLALPLAATLGRTLARYSRALLFHLARLLLPVDGATKHASTQRGLTQGGLHLTLI
jgi:hypothetical protein